MPFRQPLLMGLFLSLFINISIFAQDKVLVDSLLKSYNSQKESKDKVKTLEELFYAYIYSDPRQVLPYVDEALDMSRRLDYTEGEGVALYHKGVYFQYIVESDSAKKYYNLSREFWKADGNLEKEGSCISALSMLANNEGNYNLALKLNQESLDISRQVENPLHIGNALVMRSELFMDQGNYPEALKFGLEATKVLDTVSREPWRKADALRHVGRLEAEFGEHEKALEWFRKALAVYRASNDNIYEAHTLNDLGIAHFNLKQNDSSRYYLSESLKIGRQQNIPYVIANAQNNLGTLYSELGDFNKALAALQEGLKINETSNSAINLAGGYIQIAEVYLAKNEAQRAINYLDKSIQLSDSLGMLSELKDGYGVRAQAFEAKGNINASLADFKMFKKLEDSILNVEKSKQIEELKTVYETEKKEQEIALQQNEIDLLEQKQKASNLQNILLISGIIGLFLLFAAIYYGLRQKMKRNRLVREQLDKDLEFKSKELTTHALHLAKKNELLESLKLKAENLRSSMGNQKEYRQLIQAINFDLKDDNNWENFTRYFEQVHSGFYDKVKSKYPDISTSELRLLALLKMNMTSKEIAAILNISNDGVKKARYRLRKKLDLDSTDSLQDVVFKF